MISYPLSIMNKFLVSSQKKSVNNLKRAPDSQTLAQQKKKHASEKVKMSGGPIAPFWRNGVMMSHLNKIYLC